MKNPGQNFWKIGTKCWTVFEMFIAVNVELMMENLKISFTYVINLYKAIQNIKKYIAWIYILKLAPLQFKREYKTEEKLMPKRKKKKGKTDNLGVQQPNQDMCAPSTTIPWSKH